MTESPLVVVANDRPYRRYCRVAAGVFLLVAVYTVAVKVPSGEFATDWAHTALHVVTAVLALSLGWSRQVRAARLFTFGMLAVYGLLGVVGWFIDGLVLGTAFRIPLAPADNVFHLLLAAAALATVAASRRSSRHHHSRTWRR